jgi:hypothetical protein
MSALKGSGGQLTTTRASMPEIVLISRYDYSCWLPDLEGYSAPSPPLVDRSGVCGQLTTTGSSTCCSQLGATRP